MTEQQTEIAETEAPMEETTEETTANDVDSVVEDEVVPDAESNAVRIAQASWKRKRQLTCPCNEIGDSFQRKENQFANTTCQGEEDYQE